MVDTLSGSQSRGWAARLGLAGLIIAPILVLAFESALLTLFRAPPDANLTLALDALRKGAAHFRCDPPFNRALDERAEGASGLFALRRADLAAGGQGAPLAPVVHRALFRDALAAGGTRFACSRHHVEHTRRQPGILEHFNKGRRTGRQPPRVDGDDTHRQRRLALDRREVAVRTAGAFVVLFVLVLVLVLVDRLFELGAEAAKEEAKKAKQALKAQQKAEEKAAEKAKKKKKKKK